MPALNSKNDSELLCLQRALDKYIDSCLLNADIVLKNHLNLNETSKLQKRHFMKDLLLNPLNTIWAIPYFSIRKIIETSEKLGWQTGHSVLSKVPQSLKTDFQKEIERLIHAELFHIGSDRSFECHLTEALKSETSLEASMTSSEFHDFLALAEKQIRSSVSEFCAQQNAFTDLAASGAILIFSHFYFKENSFDIFQVSRKVASLWSKHDASNHFIFGKKLGQAFYSIAPPPAPTTFQIFITTLVAIGLLALLSTAAAVIIYPLQNAIGFQKKKLENLVHLTSDKLFLVLSKKLKEQDKRRQSA